MSNVLKTFIINDYKIVVLSILEDNFCYLVINKNKALIIDPGEAEPILKYIKNESIDALQIFITHSHSDHTGGCLELQKKLGVVSRSPSVNEEQIEILDTTCSIISTPGHTQIHKSFYFPELGIIFTGDALINGACGRILGGTANQLFKSLEKISKLPASVKIFGGHDYLEENLRFSLNENSGCKSTILRINKYKKNAADGLFVSIKNEILTNPFLRCNSLKEFILLRKRKDRF